MKLYKDNGSKIFNPVSGRYVSVNGAIGRKLVKLSDEEYNALAGGSGSGASAEEGGVKIFSADRSKILNPSSGRFVSVSGVTGRKLLRMSNDDYEKLKTGAPVPKKPVKRSEALKRVIREQQAGTIVRGVQRADQLRDNPPRSTIRNVARSLVSDEARDGVDEDVRDNYPRSTIRNVARALRDEARDRVNEVVQENPELAIIPPRHNIRDVARAIVSDDRGLAEALARSLAEEAVQPEPPVFERQVTDVDQYRPPGLQRQDTDPGSFRPPELQRQITEESRYRPPAGLQRQVTEPTMPAQEGTNYLKVLLTIADVLDEITEKLEEEEEQKPVGMTAQEIDDMIFNDIQEAIRLERMAEMKRIKEELKKEEEMDEEIWNDANYDLYALEPVEDDTPVYKETWEDNIKKMNELFDEMFGIEEVGVEEQKEVEQKEEEKRQLTAEEHIEAVRRNLLNLDFLDAGRAPFQSASSVPDPHLDAFSHIDAESKK